MLCEKNYMDTVKLHQRMTKSLLYTQKQWILEDPHANIYTHVRHFPSSSSSRFHLLISHTRCFVQNSSWKLIPYQHFKDHILSASRECNPQYLTRLLFISQC